MKIKGIAASNGIVIAQVYKLENTTLVTTKEKIKDVKLEIEKFEASILKSQHELEVIRDRTRENIDEEHAAIFDAHIQMINDPELLGAVKNKIESEKINSACCFEEVANQFVALFEAMDNDYMRERAADIKDIKNRVISHLLNIKVNDPSLINHEVIIIADDLTPSDTAQLNKKFVKGFITNIGGRTSHSAIMARSLEIPAIVGAKGILEVTKDGEKVILDGLSGEVIISPDNSQIDTYMLKAKKYEAQKEKWSLLKNQPTLTFDNNQVELAANIGSPNDLSSVLNNGAEGVGLYRTEFLYMGRDNFPTEEEQLDAYKEILLGLNGKPVVIRTLDIGGDKELSYMKMPQEMNPFLGHRAIRLCLEQTDLFKTQLRALLRASVFGKLKIMFPMIATLDEFRKAKNILLETKKELTGQGIPVSDEIEIGIMVEIPATAILADIFAKEVDFFSIGTNDLIQYTFAADRMNDAVSYLYQPYNPSLLRLIKNVIDAAHKEGKWAGMCGEMAGDSIAIPLLIGLGLDEFSMSATSILPARDLISQLDTEQMKELALKAIDMSTNQEVVDIVKTYIKEVVQ